MDGTGKGAHLIRLDDKTLYHENGVELGEILADVDGFYYFWPRFRYGSWDEAVLRAIADLLTEKNKAWREQIDRELGGG